MRVRHDSVVWFGIKFDFRGNVFVRIETRFIAPDCAIAAVKAIAHSEPIWPKKTSPVGSGSVHKGKGRN